MSQINILNRPKTEHTWSFSAVGGVKRVNLETGEDLLHLASLDPKLWTALICPVDNLEIDRRTLDLIDTDHDGQIRVPEIIDAVNWITAVIKNPDDLFRQSAAFPLYAINDQTENGRILLDSARIILKNLGKEDTATLTVAETSDTARIFAGSRFNGDGVITGESADTREQETLIGEVIQYTGSVADRDGKEGINNELLQGFFDQCAKYAAWMAKKEAGQNAILPFGADTAAAYANYCAIRSKVNDFFMRCSLAAFDHQATEALNLQMARVQSITDKDLSECSAEIAAYPIAKIGAERPLPVLKGINPAWEKQVSLFRQQVVSVLFPEKESVSEKEWQQVAAIFAPYAQWVQEKEGTAVEAPGLDRVTAILNSNGLNELSALIARDKALEQEAGNIILVDKLVRYYRDIFTLLKNFVTFYDFYNQEHKAIFQAGTLYIDQRSCDLCVKVTDMARQSALAAYSGMYLIYCDCSSKATNEKMTIVAALTNGDIDNLVVGRNALFYDRKGMDWDATVVKILDNPISIRQAFFSPYRKVSRFIENSINKFAASQDEKVTADINKGVSDIPVKEDEAAAKKEPAVPPPPPFDVGKFVGIFAAIGLALGAIGTAITSATSGFMGLVWWKMPLAILGIILLISGPSMIMAYLKLRKRNLAPILDANGWAINARVIVSIAFGNTLTHLAELPKGARINFNDPFTKKPRPILPIVFTLAVLAGIVLFLLVKNGLIHIRF